MKLGPNGLKEREKQRVQAAEMRVLRKMAGVRIIDHVRNDIRAQAGRNRGAGVCRKREVLKKQVEEQVESITEMVLSEVVPGKDQEGGQESDGTKLTDGCQHFSIRNL